MSGVKLALPILIILIKNKHKFSKPNFKNVVVKYVRNIMEIRIEFFQELMIKSYPFFDEINTVLNIF